MVAGGVSLAGALAADTINSYNPPFGTEFQPLTYASVSGQFGSVTLTGAVLDTVLPYQSHSAAANLIAVPIGTTICWVNPSGGDWDTATNWNTQVLPVSSDTVYIGLVTSIFTVTHTNNTADTVNALQADEAVTLSAGSLSVANAVVINSTFTINGA